MTSFVAGLVSSIHLSVWESSNLPAMKFFTRGADEVKDLEKSCSCGSALRRVELVKWSIGGLTVKGIVEEVD